MLQSWGGGGNSIFQLYFNYYNVRVKVNILSNNKIHMSGVNILESIGNNSIPCENVELHELQTVKDAEFENSPSEYVS